MGGWWGAGGAGGGGGGRPPPGRRKTTRRLTEDRETTGLDYCDLNNDLLLRCAPGRLFFKNPPNGCNLSVKERGELG